MAEHFLSMVELAKLHGIQVVPASVTPMCDCVKKMKGRRPPGKILSLKGWMRYAVEKAVEEVEGRVE